MTTTTTSSTIGERIRSARKQAGITRAELASAVGVSVQAIGFWETSVNEPRGHHLKALCEALGVALIDRISIAAASIMTIDQADEIRTAAAPVRPAATTAALHELLLAELIINTLQNVLTDEQRLLVGAQLATAGLQGSTPTRSTERRAAITAAGAV